MPIILQDGIIWGKTDKEGTNAGDMIDGSHTRDKEGSKTALTLKLIPLTQAQAETYLGAIDKEYITGSITDPIRGERSGVIFMCYGISNGRPIKDGNSQKWADIEFTVEEK